MKLPSYGTKHCKDSVWEKAIIVSGKDPGLYRKDTKGNVLYYKSYGKYTKMGWQIDHIKPQAKGGSHYIRNLQALQSIENIMKSDKY